MSSGIKLNLGCGNVRKEGFINVDQYPSEVTDIVEDVFVYLSSLLDSSVEEIWMVHFLEHFDGAARISLFNELYRVLEVGGKITVISPNWSSDMAYGDPTHAFPPLSVWSFYYLDKKWRDVRSPHCGYTCDFKPDIRCRATSEPWFLGLSDEQKQSRIRDSVNTCILLEVELVKQV